MKPLIQKNPFKVPTGDKKIIQEYFGLASISDGKLSIARMEAPPKWSEPFQKPEFDEYTLMVKGSLKVEVEGNIYSIKKNESILIYKNSRVKYSNPNNEIAEYWSVCIPAFSIKNVHRE